MEKEAKGVWRTVRGRRIFIEEGQDLFSAMQKSGKFKELGKRSMYQVAKNHKQFGTDETEHEFRKTQRAVGRAVEREDKKRGEKPVGYIEQSEEYKNGFKEQDNERYMPKHSSKERNRINKMTYKEKNQSEWEKQVKANNEELEKKLELLNSFKDKGHYRYNQEKWAEDYYGAFRENERKNAKIKNEMPNEKYQYVDSYATYKDKFERFRSEYRDSWTGKEYTNDEFMEHLTDSNWHTERKMLENANLTNSELTYIKDKTRLASWSVDLNKQKTEALINEAKLNTRKEKIKNYREKKYNVDGVKVSEKDMRSEYNKEVRNGNIENTSYENWKNSVVNDKNSNVSEIKSKVERFKERKGSSELTNSRSFKQEIPESVVKRLNQKGLKDLANNGAVDITRYSDADMKALENKHGRLEVVKTTKGTYGMNGGLFRSRKTGEYFVVTSRNGNLFYLA